MRDLRKTALWLGLIGSASFLSPSAMAQTATSDSPDISGTVPVQTPAEPSFRNVNAQLAPAQENSSLQIIPLPEPAIDIPLPEAAPVTALMQQDVLRMTVEGLLADDAAMRDLRLSQNERESLKAFYAQAERPLAWSQDGAFTQAAMGAIARLKSADEDGLDPADYPLPDMKLRKAAPSAQWAEADLKLSASVIRYARDARGGRIEPSRLSPLVTPTLTLPNADEVLRKVAFAKNADAALASYNPPHAGYRALKEQLVELRASHPSTPSVRVPKGPALRVGMKDPRVPLIRAHFNLKDENDNRNIYDKRLASAVAAFQKEKGLPTNGILTAQTVAALSGPSLARREADLIANMERWRWLPQDLGSRHIMVNVPEFRLQFTDGGKVVHEARVIVGKEQSQTPVFSEDMKYLVVNPSWTIPPSIMKKEILPGLANDPDYAAKKGYKVIRKNGRLIVQQPPGERNALGYVKFMFPNHHAVYLHDTPNRNLFSATKRAFSHGCVRVDKPFELAEIIMGEDSKWTEKRLRGLIGKGERTIFLPKPLPVHLAYFTLTVDERGSLKSFPDLYGLDQKVRTALNLAR
ncbi:MAG TPA: L,D-transpeptidase family protein [Microvirga sp.]|nr:L,D-transpeptidase family protein [Microvirga sp.]